MLEFLKKLDVQILLLINGTHDPVLDFIMYWISDRFIWIPFYVWLLYVLYRNYGKDTLWILTAVALMILVADQSCNLVKFSVLRYRPCHNITLEGIVHLVQGKCGGTYGFVSSHAANSMALAIFISRILPRGYKDIRWELAGYVILIAYSRVYLGTHYPLDIIGGWIIGLISGFIFAKLLQRKISVPLSMPLVHE